MANIFISYASQDRRLAKRLAGFLEDNGHQIWWDRELIAGQEFADEIDRQLKKADVIIVCWSAKSVGSNWVKSEANEGMRSERLVPVTLDGATGPRPFDQLTTLDLSKWDDDSATRLLSAIGDVPSNPIMLAFHKARQRTRLRTGLGVACAALVLAALWGPIASFIPSPTANAVAAYEKPRISEAATRHILRRLNDTGRQTSDAAFALIQTGDVHDAIRLLDKKHQALTLEPGTPAEEEAALLHQIGALAFDYNPAKAHGVYEVLVEITPDDPLALELLGELYQQEGRASEAETMYKRALTKSGISLRQALQVQIRLGQIKLRMQEFDVAQSMFTRVIAQAEENGLKHVKAKAFRHLAAMTVIVPDMDPDYGMDLVLQAIDIQSESNNQDELISSLMVRGLIAYRLGDLPSHRADQEAAAALAFEIDTPSHVNQAINNLATIAFLEERYEDAEALYLRGIQYNSEHRIDRLQELLWFGKARVSHARSEPHDTYCSHLKKAGIRSRKDVDNIPAEDMRDIVTGMKCY